MNYSYTHGLCCLLAVLAWAGCSQNGPDSKAKGRGDDAIPVTVAKTELTPMDRTISVVGTLVAKDEATIAAEVEGRVEKTQAELGDRLAGGQAMASIDTDSYQAQARLSAANLAKDKATAVNAEANLRRTQSLRLEKISSESDLDKDIATAEQARAQVKASEASLAIAELNLKRSKIIAPYECAVGERIANAGDYVKTGSPLYRIVNDLEMKFMTQVPESFGHSVQTNQRTLLTVDDWPTNTFEGRVFLISPQVNTATRDFPIAALVDNRDHKLKANSFARGRLILERDVSTPTVPIESIINFAGITRLYVVSNGVACSRTVSVGRIANERQEVLSGLQEGDVVVVTGQTKLHDGSKVRIKTAQSTDKPTAP